MKTTQNTLKELIKCLVDGNAEAFGGRAARLAELGRRGSWGHSHYSLRNLAQALERVETDNLSIERGSAFYPSSAEAVIISDEVLCAMRRISALRSDSIWEMHLSYDVHISHRSDAIYVALRDVIELGDNATRDKAFDNLLYYLCNLLDDSARVVCPKCGEFLGWGFGDFFIPTLEQREAHGIDFWANPSYAIARTISGERVFTVLCDSCRAEYALCHHCGDILSLDDEDTNCLENSNGCVYVCEDDLCYYQQCDHCGEWRLADDLETVHSRRLGEEAWCEACRDDGAQWCDNCDSYNVTEDMTWVDGEDRYVCDDCIEDDYVTCENCGGYINRCDAYESEDGDYYCESCWGERETDEEREERERMEREREERERDRLPGYHSQNGNWPMPSIEERMKHLHMGTEWEIDGGGERLSKFKEITKALGCSYEDGLCRINHDGSLNHGGEIITLPHTLEYYVNELKLEDGFAKAIELGYRSHDANTCGAHIHADRAYFRDSFVNPELGTVLLSVNNQEWLMRFSRRVRWTYCAFQTDGANKYAPDDFKCSESGEDRSRETLRQLSRIASEYQGHGGAFNFSNTPTIEFRFFRGSLNANTIRANHQLIEMWCYAIKHLRYEQLCNVDFKWFKRFALKKEYTAFLTYCEERGIMC